MRYTYTISHTPGKELITADALSRALSSTNDCTQQSFQELVENYVQLVVDSLPASSGRLKDIRKAQKEDVVCEKLLNF